MDVSDEFTSIEASGSNEGSPTSPAVYVGVVDSFPLKYSIPRIGRTRRYSILRLLIDAFDDFLAGETLRKAMYRLRGRYL